jgi:predicted RNase H-like HicB family nuclease
MANGVKTGGRQAGTPNKATQEARQAIALFVDQNAHRLTEWLNAVADGDPLNDIKPNPAKAFEMFQSVVEYHIPKLARTELAGDADKPIELKVTWQK